jgi:hypothetical protein
LFHLLEDRGGGRTRGEVESRQWCYVVVVVDASNISAMNMKEKWRLLHQRRRRTLVAQINRMHHGAAESNAAEGRHNNDSSSPTWIASEN